MRTGLHCSNKRLRAPLSTRVSGAHGMRCIPVCRISVCGRLAGTCLPSQLPHPMAAPAGAAFLPDCRRHVYIFSIRNATTWWPFAQARQRYPYFNRFWWRRELWGRPARITVGKISGQAFSASPFFSVDSNLYHQGAGTPVALTVDTKGGRRLTTLGRQRILRFAGSAYYAHAYFNAVLAAPAEI